MLNVLVSRFRIFVLSVAALLGASAFAQPASAGMNDYCQVPPYVIQNVPPNILILQDISGSTLNFAYQDSFDNNYVSPAGNHGYYGYFDGNYWYTYGSNKFTRSRLKSAGAKAAAEWDGNFLNWLIMRRADVIRKVLTGGRVSGSVIDCEQPDGAGRGITKTIANAALYTGINVNQARTFTFSTSGTFTMTTTNAAGNNAVSFRPQLDVPTPVEGVLQDTDVGAKGRLGLAMFNTDEGGNVVVSVAASNLASAVNQINLTHAATNTPLAEALWSVTGYFAQQDRLPPYSGGPGPNYGSDYTVNANNDPMNFGSGGVARYPVCQKSFVLLITDGEPCSDGNLPAAVRDFATTKGSPFNCTNQDCPAVTQGTASFPAFDLSTVSCFGDGGLSTSGNEAGLEDVALYAHTTDLRNRNGSPNIGIDNIAGMQNLTLFVVQAFGSGSAVLQYAAINGGFEDNGSGYPATQSSWDKDGNGVPDNYYGADDGWALEAAIREALSTILKRASSGTAASVLASGEGSGANLLQAIFYPRRRFGNDVIGWTGSLQNLWYYVDPFFTNANIREETTVDGKLNLTNDYIAKFYYDSATETTKVSRFSDSDGNGTINTAVDNVSFESMASLWEAGKLLFTRNITDNPRDIKTNLTGASTFAEFSEGQASTLAPYMLDSADNALKTIRFVHGYDDDPIANRRRTVTAMGIDNGVWKLGDVIDSTPRVVASVALNKYDTAYQDTTYKAFISDNAYKNRGMAFVGGNDGMLHAFKMGKLELQWTGRGAFEKAKMTNLDPSIPLGTEMWAFIPKNALPYLKYLSDNQYCHLYYVDLAPYVFDASIGQTPGDDQSTDPRTIDSWRTVLIGGMRFGGACANVCASGSDCVKTPATDAGYSSYFALDVTDPDEPIFMWEFSSPQLGFATTGPSIVRINGKIPSTETRARDRNGEWYVVFGSGPTGPIDTTSMQFLGRSNQNLRYFVLNLKTGAVVQTIDTGITNAFGGSMINTVADVDLDYQDDAIYTGYTKRAGLSAPYSWTNGGVGRILTKETTPENSTDGWAFSRVIDDVGPVTTAISRLQNNVYHNHWLYFGTGRFFFAQPPEGTSSTPVIDDADSQRRLIAVKDPCFTEQNLLNPACTAPPVTFPSTADATFPNVTDVANAPSAEVANGAAFKGWYVNLDPTNYFTYDNVSQYFRAERVITDPLASTSGFVFFTTFKPYGQECGLGGKSFIWALQYNTGGAPAQGVIKGKALVQVSTASVEQIDMSEAFKPAAGEPAGGLHKGGRRSFSIEGVPPTAQGLSLLLPPPPVNRVLHMKER